MPHSFDEIENVWIPMPDGCRLAARLWLPQTSQPVPALLEYLPYRKRDFTRSRDEPIHRYFAAQGYASLRVDIRGSGDSDGILSDEYSTQELDDALGVLAWLAAQPWCDGSVGMFGKSWGGFNALQVAALDPPQLKAVISVCASDDRYADDAHYMGGCLLNENLIWGSSLFTSNALPPDPEISGPRWRDKWRERLDNAVPFPALWMRHQRRDAYWRRGSICEDYSAIRCPVYLFGGWADGYTNAVPRLLAGLTAPRKALIGPWAHAYPHDGVPGPAIGFLQESVRWWDHWLKGHDTGIMAEPLLRVWMQDWVLPRSAIAVQPGRWVAEQSWPSARSEPLRLHLAPNSLAAKAGSEEVLTVASPLACGLAGGEWCPFSGNGDLPSDQRRDDAGSLTFDSAPLTAPMDILGAPQVELELAVDRPQALIAVRLNDVAPDGASGRVTYGLLNLSQRESRAEPQAMVPGERTRVGLVLNHVAHRFPPGHRVRLAVSTSYWPMAWPSPEPVSLRLWTGASTIELPVRPSSPEDEHLAALAPPDKAPASGSGASTRKLELDIRNEELRLTIQHGLDDHGELLLSAMKAIDLQAGFGVRRCHRVKGSDPLSAESIIERRVVMRRTGWSIAIETRTRLTATRDAFRLEASLRVREGDTEVFHRAWDEAIPRDHV